VRIYKNRLNRDAYRTINRQENRNAFGSRSEWRRTGFPLTSVETRLRQKGGDLMDFSNMDITDWIIRASIFGVLACVVIGTLQNLVGAIRDRNQTK
jgi:hypothetical protein